MHTFKMLFNVSFCILQQQFDQYILHIKTSRQLFVPACCDITRQKHSSPPVFLFCLSSSTHPCVHLSINQVGYSSQKLIRTKQSALCVSPLFIKGTYKPLCAKCVCVRTCLSVCSTSAYLTRSANYLARLMKVSVFICLCADGLYLIEISTPLQPSCHLSS